MNGWSNKPSFVVGLFRFLCYGAGLFWLPFFLKSDGSDVVSNSDIDFEEYELHGSIQLDRISEGVKHRTMATQFFSVYVRSSEWSIAV